MFKATFVMSYEHLSRKFIRGLERLFLLSRELVSPSGIWQLTLTYCTMGHLFGVSKATVCCVIKEVCESIVSVLLPRYISVPSGDDFIAVCGWFYKWFRIPTMCRSG